MRKVTLVRYYTPGLGTVGELSEGSFKCVTMERDWLGNAQGVSCIPEGTYLCMIGPSTRNLPVSTVAYEVMSVPGRTAIKIHIANKASELEGCVALGRTVNAVPEGGKMVLTVTHSSPTMQEFLRYMGEEPFHLEIKQYRPG